MDITGEAMQLTAYVGVDDSYEDRPLWEALVDASRTSGCAGATVTRGLSGFGATSRLFDRHKPRMSRDDPVVVTVVDVRHRVAALAEVFAAMVGDGLVTLHEVEVIVYRGGVTGGPAV